MIRAVIFIGGLAILPFWGASYYLALALGVPEGSAPPVAWGIFLGTIALIWLALFAWEKSGPEYDPSA